MYFKFRGHHLRFFTSALVVVGSVIVTVGLTILAIFLVNIQLNTKSYG